MADYRPEISPELEQTFLQIGLLMAVRYAAYHNGKLPTLDEFLEWIDRRARITKAIPLGEDEDPFSHPSEHEKASGP